ncbi:hypothetical protein ABIE62_001450 [Porphyrobacter sp. MBR-155]|jgi:hypothetical protein|uniref:hypothetical protein n=1 Tax=Porphyrobacter sp. MBR-155 TaxID=3156464 RepID=UPI00339A8D83
MLKQKYRFGVLLGALALVGCGESDFSRGVWTSPQMAEFTCRGNLMVLGVDSDRVQLASLGSVAEEWPNLKTQFREGGSVIVKGRAGDVFRFRDEGDGTITLEEAPDTLEAYFITPAELVNCANFKQG